LCTLSQITTLNRKKSEGGNDFLVVYNFYCIVKSK